MEPGANDHQLSGPQREALIRWLGDSPQTVVSIDRLRRGLGRAHISGPVDAPAAVVIQPHPDSPWPAGFGDDPELLWTLLSGIDGWEAIHVALPMAGAMAEVVERETGRAPELIEEIYFLPSGPLIAPPHPDIRRLTKVDVPLMERATETLGMQGWRLGSARGLVTEGIVSGAVVDGELVAIGFTSCWSDRYAEVGIVTREDFRNRGLSTAAGAMVCAEIQQAGRTPVWSTSEENAASRRVGAKLGFVETSRRVYVNRR